MGLLIAEANTSIPYLFVIYFTSVGSDILQRQTLRWLVHVAGSSQI